MFCITVYESLLGRCFHTDVRFLCQQMFLNEPTFLKLHLPSPSTNPFARGEVVLFVSHAEGTNVRKLCDCNTMRIVADSLFSRHLKKKLSVLIKLS
jgi:hypothetical protein